VKKTLTYTRAALLFPFFIAALGVKSVNHQGEAYLCSGSKSCSKVRGRKSEMNGEAASVEE